MYPKCALLAFFRKLKMSLNVFYYFLLISLFRTGVWRDSLKWQVQVHLFFFLVVYDRKLHFVNA